VGVSFRQAYARRFFPAGPSKVVTSHRGEARAHRDSLPVRALRVLRAPCDAAFPTPPLSPHRSQRTQSNSPPASAPSAFSAVEARFNPPPRSGFGCRFGHICGVNFTDLVLNVAPLRRRTNRSQERRACWLGLGCAVAMKALGAAGWGSGEMALPRRWGARLRAADKAGSGRVLGLLQARRPRSQETRAVSWPAMAEKRAAGEGTGPKGGSLLVCPGNPVSGFLSRCGAVARLIEGYASVSTVDPGNRVA
jgi:hypothetical protein